MSGRRGMDAVGKQLLRQLRVLLLDGGFIPSLAARPWEPHKYPSKEAQDANLALLIGWIREAALATWWKAPGASAVVSP